MLFWTAFLSIFLFAKSWRERGVNCARVVSLTAVHFTVRSPFCWVTPQLLTTVLFRWTLVSRSSIVFGARVHCFVVWCIVFSANQRRPCKSCDIAHSVTEHSYVNHRQTIGRLTSRYAIWSHTFTVICNGWHRLDSSDREKCSIKYRILHLFIPSWDLL